MTDAALSAERRSSAEGGLSPFRIFQFTGFVTFTLLTLAIGWDIARGAAAFGALWLVPVVILAYATADFVSGVVHFLADNFGSPETPVFGPAFIKPFRDHHTDPKGILYHPFMIANGNNCLVSLPPLLFVWLVVPVTTSRNAFVLGSFILFLSLAIFLTNQFHKWAHMDEPPAWVGLLQRSGLVLSKEHHDIHHASPFDTYYCITAGWWNPLLERTGFFEKAERVIRSYSIRRSDTGPLKERIVTRVPPPALDALSSDPRP